METYYLFALLGSLALGSAHAQGLSGCSFPPHWRDSWVMNGYGRNIRLSISHNTIPSKGQCIMSREDHQYLLRSRESSSEQEVCYRCLVFTQRHANVIQYKEGVMCDPDDTENLFDRICSLIGGDAPLHTLVREHAVPISCPVALLGPLTFRYDSGLGYCEEPDSISTLNFCASSNRLQLNMASCNSPYYEPVVTEIQCLATWRSGGYWLYVKYGDNDYRCMRYDITSMLLSMTNDASCMGIATDFGAPNLFNLENGIARPRQHMCTYPKWFDQRIWMDLQGEFSYRYDLVTNELVVDKTYHRPGQRYTETYQRLTCNERVRDTEDEVTFVTQVIKGCDHGYQCVKFRKRSHNVIEIFTGGITKTASRACNERHMNSQSSETRLLIDSYTDAISCPLTGKYNLYTSSTLCSINMEVGCEETSSVVFKECDMQKMSLECLATWTERGVNHLVIAEKTYPRRGNCYTYRNDSTSLTLAMAEDCNYNAPPLVNANLPSPPYKLAKPEPCHPPDNVGDKYPKGTKQHIKDSISSSHKQSYSCLLLALLTIVSVSLGEGS